MSVELAYRYHGTDEDCQKDFIHSQVLWTSDESMHCPVSCTSVSSAARSSMDFCFGAAVRVDLLSVLCVPVCSTCMAKRL